MSSGHCLPMPEELDGSRPSQMETRWEQIERLLGNDGVVCTTIWPIANLTLAEDAFPLATDLLITRMSDQECGEAHKRGLLADEPSPSWFLTRSDAGDTDFDILEVAPSTDGSAAPSFLESQSLRFCLKYTYTVGITVGDEWDWEGARRHRERLEEVLQTFLDAFTLITQERIGIVGMLTWIHLPGMSRAHCQEMRGIRDVRPRDSHEAQAIDLTQEMCLQLRRTWSLLTDEKWTENRALMLAVRRLSRQGSRESDDDKILDILIAAEALYLTDLGGTKDRGELSYRLSHRAGLWADPERTGRSREVSRVMRLAYNVRSIIAHGGAPKERDLRIGDMRYSLAELVDASRSVVVAGVTKALDHIRSGQIRKWPIDWEELVH